MSYIICLSLVVCGRCLYLWFEWFGLSECLEFLVMFSTASASDLHPTEFGVWKIWLLRFVKRICSSEILRVVASKCCSAIPSLGGENIYIIKIVSVEHATSDLLSTRSQVLLDEWWPWYERCSSWPGSYSMVLKLCLLQGSYVAFVNCHLRLDIYFKVIAK